MNWLELSLLALAVSMDAFAVAVTVGLTMAKVSIKKALVVGAYFGGFQAGMPLIGYIVAIQFSERLLSFNHWIVFGLLVFLGIRMVIGSRKCPAGKQEASLKPAKMIPLALATSVDAMAVGVSLAFMQVILFTSKTCYNKDR